MYLLDDMDLGDFGCAEGVKLSYDAIAYFMDTAVQGEYISQLTPSGKWPHNTKNENLI